MKFDNLTERIRFATATYGEPRPFRLEQYGDLDVTFDGWKITNVDNEAATNRNSVDITLFYSNAGSYIGYIVRHMPPSGSSPAVKKSKVGTFASPLELLNWLREDGRGYLGHNSKIAWEEMCIRLPWLQVNATKRV